MRYSNDSIVNALSEAHMTVREAVEQHPNTLPEQVEALPEACYGCTEGWTFKGKCAVCGEKVVAA